MPKRAALNPKKVLNIRVENTTWLEQRCREDGVMRDEVDPDSGEWVKAPNLSEMARRCLQYAEAHMPPGWVPGRD